MSGNPGVLRAIVGLGSVVLIGTAVFHGSAYTAVARALDKAGLDGFLGGGLKGLWLMFSIQLFVVALLCFSVVWRPDGQTRKVMFFCSVLLALETVLLFWSVGFFIGEVLLGATVFCYVLAASLIRR